MFKTFICKLFVFLIICIVNIEAAQREYYNILGLKQTATQQEIKKAYRKLSRQYHPDINKEDDATEKFSKINVAYEALSDPDKRRKYDQYGEEGLKEKPQQSQSPFGSFFGQQQQGEQKGPELLVKIQVTLEDIYKGAEVPVYTTRRTICPHCRGSGADDPDDVQECPVCKGKGFTLKKQQIFGFVQQVQVDCDRCSGRGKISKTKCHVCKGKKIINGQDQISLFIEKGIQNGHNIKYEGSGDDHADMGTSDVVFQIIQIPHKVFERKGDDLYTKLTISLEEALLGFKKKIKHLDSHFIKIDKSNVTQPGEIQKFEGEGMPQHEFSSNYGNLYIEYNVEFPEKFTDEQLELWEQFFNAK